jgi:hypothetical protein
MATGIVIAIIVIAIGLGAWYLIKRGKLNIPTDKPSV